MGKRLTIKPHWAEVQAERGRTRHALRAIIRNRTVFQWWGDASIVYPDLISHDYWEDCIHSLTNMLYMNRHSHFIYMKLYSYLHYENHVLLYSIGNIERYFSSFCSVWHVLWEERQTQLYVNGRPSRKTCRAGICHQRNEEAIWSRRSPTLISRQRLLRAWIVSMD